MNRYLLVVFLIFVLFPTQLLIYSNASKVNSWASSSISDYYAILAASCTTKLCGIVAYFNNVSFYALVYELLLFVYACILV